ASADEIFREVLTGGEKLWFGQELKAWQFAAQKFVRNALKYNHRLQAAAHLRHVVPFNDIVQARKGTVGLKESLKRKLHIFLSQGPAVVKTQVWTQIKSV